MKQAFIEKKNFARAAWNTATPDLTSNTAQIFQVFYTDKAA